MLSRGPHYKHCPAYNNHRSAILVLPIPPIHHKFSPLIRRISTQHSCLLLFCLSCRLAMLQTEALHLRRILRSIVGSTRDTRCPVPSPACLPEHRSNQLRVLRVLRALPLPDFGFFGFFLYQFAERPARVVPTRCFACRSTYPRQVSEARAFFVDPFEIL